MKIRRGFVSNSSSSSFTLLTGEEDFERALKEMEEKNAQYLRNIVGTKKFGSFNLIILSCYFGDEVHNLLTKWKNMDVLPSMQGKIGRMVEAHSVVSLTYKYIEALKKTNADFTFGHASS